MKNKTKLPIPENTSQKHHKLIQHLEESMQKKTDLLVVEL